LAYFTLTFADPLISFLFNIQSHFPQHFTCVLGSSVSDLVDWVQGLLPSITDLSMPYLSPLLSLVSFMTKHSETIVAIR